MSDNIGIDTVYNPYYKLDTGEIYDKDDQKFVTVETDADFKQFTDNGNLPLSINDNGYTKDQLINSVLKFYGWPIGECLLSLEELKTQKILELETISSAFEESPNKDMFFISSLRFKSDGDRRTLTNIDKLIENFDKVAVTVEDAQKVVDYWDYDNVTRQLTKEQLQKLSEEHALNGFALYEQKRQLRVAITTAKSIEDLKKIEIKFTMQDFTA